MADTTNADEHDPIADFLVNLREVTRDLVHRTLGVERSPASLDALVDGAYGIADLAMDRLATMLPSDRPLDCGRQCSHCCKQALVMTDPATILHIAHQVTTRLDPMVLSAWGLRLATRARRPCALLEEEICSVYGARPVICRAYNAYDSAACETGDLPNLRGTVADRGYPVPYAIAAAMATGLAEGLDALGLHSNQVEMNAALRIAMTTPDAAQRWLAGEDVFSEARQGPVTPAPVKGEA
ncbi:MAG: YkgJ family cysteine cluster protein [Alphaproteobacteria bacterium]